MNQDPKGITRENHLDHMVKVVPFIVMGYALQCYVIIQWGLSGFATDTLLFLGVCLVVMIGGFFIYSNKHQVSFHQDHLQIDFLWRHSQVAYTDIVSMEVMDEEQSFGTLILKCRNDQNYRFYFIDDADKIKSWLQSKKHSSFSSAA